MNLDELKTAVDEIFGELVKLSQVNEFIVLTNKLQAIRQKLEDFEKGTQAVTPTVPTTPVVTEPVVPVEIAPVDAVAPVPTEEVAQ